jgi:uncharacterized glyoxalase superfamily protein PhnB
MKHNRSVPPATVVPVLSYPDVRAAVAWLSAAFGFAERTRIGDSHRASASSISVSASFSCRGIMRGAAGKDLRSSHPHPRDPRSWCAETRFRWSGACTATLSGAVNAYAISGFTSREASLPSPAAWSVVRVP